MIVIYAPQITHFLHFYFLTQTIKILQEKKYISNFREKQLKRRLGSLTLIEQISADTSVKKEKHSPVLLNWYL